MSTVLYWDLSYKVQGAFFEVYKNLGCGYKEIIYQNALIKELTNNKLRVESQKRLFVYYKDERVGVYTPDLVVEDKILVEIKSKPSLIPLDMKQFWHYLRGSEYKVGYLVNFGSLEKVEYIRRVYDIARNTLTD